MARQQHNVRGIELQSIGEASDTPDLLVQAAHHRAFGALIDISAPTEQSGIDPLTGQPLFKRSYSNALLSMLTKAHRPEQHTKPKAYDVERLRCQIADDPDPPRMDRGRRDL